MLLRVVGMAEVAVVVETVVGKVEMVVGVAGGEEVEVVGKLTVMEVEVKVVEVLLVVMAVVVVVVGKVVVVVRVSFQKSSGRRLFTAELQ